LSERAPQDKEQSNFPAKERKNKNMVTFADDTVILSGSRRAASDLQYHLNTLQTWFEKWPIRINENKSCSITFTLRKSSTPEVTINDIKIP
jgi:hypothetical protein